MNHDDIIADYFRLTREVLPARALAENWVVQADHCFQRIVLDNVVGDAWRNKLTAKTAAYHQLTDDQLQQAVSLATQIEREGDAFLRKLNRNSLGWRGKLMT